MAFTFRNGEHHRNPSGCHNKVKWFLSQSKWDIKTLESITNNFIEFELLERKFPIVQIIEVKEIQKWLYGWLEAVNISLFILDDKYRGHLPYYAYEKYPWISQYKPYVPYLEWKAKNE